MLNKFARIVIITTLAVFAAFFVVMATAISASRGRARKLGLERPDRSALAIVRLAAREALATLRMLSWRLLPREERAHIVPVPRDRDVLCIHGFTQNGTNWHVLRQALDRAGRSSRVLSLGRLGQGLDGYAQTIIRALSARSEPVDVVCHSMGGLVLRQALSMRPELQERVGRVVTLGTPHKGTAAVFAQKPRLREVDEMRFGGAYTHALAPLSELLPGHAITTIGSEDDQTVFPVETALADGNMQVRLRDIGHAGLLSHPAAIRATLIALERDLS